MRRFLTTLALVAFAATPAFAQTSATANLNSTAMIVDPISLSVSAPLDFGKMTASQTKVIGVDNATSGRFYIQGTGGVSVNLSMTLPTNLTSGANNLPVGTFTASYNSADAAAGTAFNPSTVAVVPISGTGATQRAYIRVGGTATSGAGQAGGTYTGVIALSVDYN